MCDVSRHYASEAKVKAVERYDEATVLVDKSRGEKRRVGRR